MIDSSMAKREGGPDVESVTEYETLFVSDVRLSLVEARPRTGRRHQIRRHLRRIRSSHCGRRQVRETAPTTAAIAPSSVFTRLALHAKRLSFVHPTSGERVTFESAIPEDLAGPLRRDRRASDAPW